LPPCAIGVNFTVPTSVGPIRADVLAAKKVPKRAWNRLSCGQGAKATRLFTHLLRDVPTTLAARRMAFRLQWSTWRRRHQARARRHHHKRRLTDLD
jgi:hypothetical protein